MRTRADDGRYRMMSQESLISSIAFVEFIATIAAAYIASALVLGIAFAVMRKLRDRKRSRLSEKYTAAFAMIYMVERLHGKRMHDSRDKVLQAIWASDPNW